VDWTTTKDGDVITFCKKFPSNLKEVTRDVKFVPYSEKQLKVDSVVTAFVKRQRHLPRYERLVTYDLRTMDDGLAFIFPRGYTDNLKPSTYGSFGSQKVIALYEDIVHALAPIVQESDLDALNTLPINKSRPHNFAVCICNNPDFHVPLEHYPQSILDSVANACDLAWSYSFANTTVDKIPLKNKKKTSIGWPFEKIDGSPIKVVDVLHGIKDHILSIRTRFKRDFSPFKAEWRNDLRHGCLQLFKNQIAFLKMGIPITKDNICTLLAERIITFITFGIRTNNSDALRLTRAQLAVFKMAAKRTKDESTKDRRFSQPTKTGVINGMVDSQCSNEYNDKIGASPGPNAKFRLFYIPDEMAQTVGQTLIRACLHTAEKGTYGNIADRPEIYRAYDLATIWAKEHGYTYIYVSTGDCTNAEVTASSSPEIWYGVFPKRFREYYKLSKIGAYCIDTDRNMHVQKDGHFSGGWYTTGGHIPKGILDNTRKDYLKAKINNLVVYPLEDILITVVLRHWFVDTPIWNDVKSHLKCFSPTAELVEYGPDVMGQPWLPTDDMPSRIFSKKPLTEEVDMEMDMVGTDTGDSAVVFGMHMTSEKLEVNVGSILAKVFWNENMGYALHDRATMYMKLKSLPPEYQAAIGRVFSKYGFSIEDYAVDLQDWMEYIKQNPGEGEAWWNEYSPTEQRVYSMTLAKYFDIHGTIIEVQVGEEKVKMVEVTENITETRSSRVPEDVVQAYYDELSKVFWDDITVYRDKDFILSQIDALYAHNYKPQPCSMDNVELKIDF